MGGRPLTLSALARRFCCYFATRDRRIVAERIYGLEAVPSTSTGAVILHHSDHA